MKKPVTLVPSAKAGRTLKTGLRGNGRSREADARIDPAVAKWFEKAKAEFPASRSSTIPMLQSAQAALGYLPRDAMRAIGRHLGAAPAVVEGVASFYAQFRFNKPGKHRVTVCSGTACYVRGSGKLMEDIQKDLKIVPGGTSADGAISLEAVSCFGACALAPVVVLDDKVLRQQTSVSIKKVLHELSAGTAKGRARGAKAKSAARGARK
jgi:NADH-quinone oxidoreductase subunit E